MKQLEFDFMGDTEKAIKVGDTVSYVGLDAFAKRTEKRGVALQIKDGKVYLGGKRWVKITNVIRYESGDNNGQGTND